MRHRRGYRQLDPGDDVNQPLDNPDGPTTETNEDIVNDVEHHTDGEDLQHGGWYSLSWSFVASGLLTVTDCRRSPLFASECLPSSFLLTSSQLRLQSRCSGIILLASGYGTSLPVYHT